MDLGKPMPWFVFTILGCGLAFIIHHAIVHKTDIVCFILTFNFFLCVCVLQFILLLLFFSVPCTFSSFRPCDSIDVLCVDDSWTRFPLVGFYHGGLLMDNTVAFLILSFGIITTIVCLFVRSLHRSGHLESSYISDCEGVFVKQEKTSRKLKMMTQTLK